MDINRFKLSILTGTSPGHRDIVLFGQNEASQPESLVTVGNNHDAKHHEHLRRTGDVELNTGKKCKAELEIEMEIILQVVLHILEQDLLADQESAGE